MVNYSQLRQVKNLLDMKEPTHIQVTLMELQYTHRIMEMELFIEIVCRIMEMITGISIKLQAGFGKIGSCPAFFCLGSIFSILPNPGYRIGKRRPVVAQK